MALTVEQQQTVSSSHVKDEVLDDTNVQQKASEAYVAQDKNEPVDNDSAQQPAPLTSGVSNESIEDEHIENKSYLVEEEAVEEDKEDTKVENDNTTEENIESDALLAPIPSVQSHSENENIDDSNENAQTDAGVSTEQTETTVNAVTGKTEQKKKKETLTLDMAKPSEELWEKLQKEFPNQCKRNGNKIEIEIKSRADLDKLKALAGEKGAFRNIISNGAVLDKKIAELEKKFPAQAKNQNTAQQQAQPAAQPQIQQRPQMQMRPQPQVQQDEHIKQQEQIRQNMQPKMQPQPALQPQIQQQQQVQLQAQMQPQAVAFHAAFVQNGLVLVNNGADRSFNFQEDFTKENYPGLKMSGNNRAVVELNNTNDVNQFNSFLQKHGDKIENQEAVQNWLTNVQDNINKNDGQYDRGATHTTAPQLMSNAANVTKRPEDEMAAAQDKNGLAKVGDAISSAMEAAMSSRATMRM